MSQKGSLHGKGLQTSRSAGSQKVEDLLSTLRDDETGRGTCMFSSQLLEEAEKHGAEGKQQDHTTTPDLQMSMERAANVMHGYAVAQSLTLLDRSVLVGAAHDEHARFTGCCKLLFAIAYFVGYVMAAALHVDTSQVHLQEKPFREVLMPPLEDVLEINDVWTYLNETFVPTFFRQTDMYGMPLPKQDWSRIFTYNQLQGAAVFEQTRTVVQKCDFEVASHVSIHPVDELSTEPYGRPLDELPDVDRSILRSDNEGFVIDADTVSRRLRTEREELRHWMPQAGPADKRFTFSLYANTEYSVVEQRLRYLRRRNWFDEQSSVATVKALVLNSEIGTPLLQRITLTFSFSRGGGIFTKLRFQTTFLRPFSSTLNIIADMFFVTFLLLDTGGMIASMSIACRKCALMTHCRNGMTLFQFGMVFVSWISVLCFFFQYRTQQIVNSKLEALSAAGTSPQGAELEGLVEELGAAADDAALFTSWYQTLMTYMNLLLMVRCFLALKFQPRLALVLETLRATSVDLGHFLIIFIPTFIAFAISGMCIFGRRMDQFSSITRSIGTCFKIAVEIEFDWETMAGEDFWTTATWVWTFVMLICLIMLNMVLAIIMDVYDEVSHASNSKESLVDTMRHNLERIYRWRAWVNTEDIVNTLNNMGEVITIDEFRLAFPDMTEVQLNWLVDSAKAKLRSTLFKESGSSLSHDMLAAINLGVGRVNKLLGEVRERRDRSMAEGQRSSRACVEEILQSIAVQNHWMTFVQEQLDHLRQTTRCFEEAAGGDKEFEVGVDEDNPGMATNGEQMALAADADGSARHGCS